jgi:hypothetical protein
MCADAGKRCAFQSNHGGDGSSTFAFISLPTIRCPPRGRPSAHGGSVVRGFGARFRVSRDFTQGPFELCVWGAAEFGLVAPFDVGDDLVGDTIMVASLRYLDTFSKIDQSWYFAERKLILDWSETRLMMVSAAA